MSDRAMEPDKPKRHPLSPPVRAAAVPEAREAAEATDGRHQRSYQAAADTLRILRDLREAFGLATDSAVIRRALALARVIVRAAQGADTIVVRKRDGGELEIVLRG